MPLTRDQTEELKSIVNVSLKHLWTDPDFIKMIVDKVADGISTEVNKKLLMFEEQLIDIENKYKSDMFEVKSELKCFKDENEKLRQRVEQLDQISRCCNLRVFNLQEKDNENTTTSVVKILNLKMNIGLDESDIQECYRIGRLNKEKQRGILLKLKNFEMKQKIYNSKKFLKGTGLVVREDITANRLKIMEEAIKCTNIKSVWTQNGNVFVKKNNSICKILKMEDLKKFMYSK